MSSLFGLVEEDIASLRTGTKSFLLSSIAIIPFEQFSIFITIERPSTISFALAYIVAASIHRYGSHSAPFAITYSIFASGGGDSLTCVGNEAPPIPVMPASLIRLIASSLVISKGSRIGKNSSLFSSSN